MRLSWAFAMFLAACPCGWGQVGASIPPVHGTVLAGAQVDLPGSLRGRVGVLVMGFTQGSRAEVTEWGKRLNADYAQSPTVSHYEMAMVASVPKVVRGLVVMKIKDSIPEPGQRTFVPVEDHQKDWKRIAAFGAEDDAYVLVVDGSGVVRWRFQGACTAASYEAMHRAIAAVRGR